MDSSVGENKRRVQPAQLLHSRPRYNSYHSLSDWDKLKMSFYRSTSCPPTQIACAGILEQSMQEPSRNKVVVPRRFFTIFKLLRSPGIDSKERGLSCTDNRARICKRLWSPEIDSEESIRQAYVAWRAGRTNRVVVPARQARNRFLGSLKGLQIRTQEPVLLLLDLSTRQRPMLYLNVSTKQGPELHLNVCGQQKPVLA